MNADQAFWQTRHGALGWSLHNYAPVVGPLWVSVQRGCFKSSERVVIVILLRRGHRLVNYWGKWVEWLWVTLSGPAIMTSSIVVLVLDGMESILSESCSMGRMVDNDSGCREFGFGRGRADDLVGPDGRTSLCRVLLNLDAASTETIAHRDEKLEDNDEQARPVKLEKIG